MGKKVLNEVSLSWRDFVLSMDCAWSKKRNYHFELLYSQKIQHTRVISYLTSLNQFSQCNLTFEIYKNDPRSVEEFSFYILTVKRWRHRVSWNGHILKNSNNKYCKNDHKHCHNYTKPLFFPSLEVTNCFRDDAVQSVVNDGLSSMLFWLQTVRNGVVEERWKGKN